MDNVNTAERARETTAVSAGEMQPVPIKKKKTNRKTIAFICCCTIPTFVLYAIFVLYPVFNMFYLSFHDWDGLLGAKIFIGLDNYKTLFQDVRFGNAFVHTITYIFFVTIITSVFALYFAALLSKSKIRFKPFFRILFYIPNILSVVVISAIFTSMYAADYGLVAGIMDWFNKPYTGLMGDQRYIQMGIIIAMVWQAIGYYMVMYIAGMDSIPDELYESASLDGAGNSRQFFVITLPLTWEVVRVTLTFFIISTINMSFLFVKAMTAGSGGINFSAEVLLNYMENRRNNSYMGYAMTIGTVLFIFAYTLALLVNFLTKVRDKDAR